MSLRSIDPKELSIPVRHHYLLGSVGPRPVAFVSTVNAEGVPNLAPFSFFNVFSSNPPILIFSPARSGKTGATKNTLDNVLEVKECVINIVNFDMVHQMSLASSPYPKGVNEFVKSGFTEQASEVVQPPRVAESPVQFECKVLEVKALGDQGGAGNLVICEVVRMHILEELIGENDRIDQKAIDLVARMGGNFYSRAHGDSLFEIDKPITTSGVGVDALPDCIRLSDKLTGNDLGILGNMHELPSEEDVENELKNVAEHEMTLSGGKLLLHEYDVQKAYAILYTLLKS